MLFDLSNTGMHSLQMILKAVVRIIFNMPRLYTERITPNVIKFYFSHFKARIGLKLCLEAH